MKSRFNLVKLHKIGAYLMVLIAFATLATGTAFSPIVSGVAVLIGVFSWFWEEPRVNPARFGTFWTLLTVGAIAAAGFGIFLSPMPGVEVAVHFVLYLTLAKFFQRARLDDYLQIFALSFLLLAAGTAFNEDVLFGALFAAYVIVGVITFAMHHLRVELQDARERGAQPSRGLFGGQYLGVLGGLSLTIFLSSVAFFFLFPRLGFGYFVKKERQSAAATGFSETVDLGSHGTIQSDQKVFMRVTFENDPPPKNLQYWRGISFDAYDGNRWTSSLNTKSPIVPNADFRYPVLDFDNPKEVETQLFRQRIYIEPSNTQVVFGLPRLASIQLADKNQVIPTWMSNLGFKRSPNGDVRFAQPHEVGYQYTAFSLLARPTASELNTIDTEELTRQMHPKHRKLYLQTPDVSQKTKDLAAQITKDAKTPFEKVLAVERYLKANYTYTTTLRDPGEEAPLEAFLHTHKRGHCEFFATAMSILLRTQGVYTRNVNGFLGGEWNSYDDYLAVRNADAHSWTEVWFGPYGWIHFDPTPSAEVFAAVQAQTPWYAELAKVYDSLRFQWFKYVIEYDLQTQVDLLRQLTQALGADPEAAKPSNFAYTLRDLLLSLRGNGWRSLVWMLLAFAGALALRLRGRPRFEWQDGATIIVQIGGLTAVLWTWRPEASAMVFGIGLTVPAALDAVALFQRLREGRTKKVDLSALSKVYLQLKDILASGGLPVAKHTGPDEVLRLLNRSQLPLKPAISRVVTLYMEARFGGRFLTKDAFRRLKSDVKKIEEAINRRAA